LIADFLRKADFKGELRAGLYWKGEWLDKDDLDVLDERHSAVTSKFAEGTTTHVKVGVAMSALLTMVGIVFAVTAAVLSFRLFVQKASSLGGAIAGGAANAVSIIIMNGVWQIVAEKMTLWENHRTETDYRDNLIFKIFTFQFCNSYASFYYIAFFKGNTIFWGKSTGLQDGCRVDWGEDNDTVAAACVDELTMQVITVLLVNMFIGQAREVAIPYLLKKMKTVLFLRAMITAMGGEDEDEELLEQRKKLPAYEREALRVDWPGTFEEYSEMVIQYGYITLFAAVFPLAPLLALLNNIVEIRTDAAKMLTQHNRPHYAGAQDIGSWYGILDVMGFFAVATNCLLIGFSYSPIYKIVNENTFQVFAVVVLMEHFLLACKYLIAFMIPDVPAAVGHERARADYVKQVNLKKAKTEAARAAGLHYSSEEDDDELDDGDDDSDLAPGAVQVDVADGSESESDD
jgi:Calcium-activated chloride channel